MKFTEDTLLCHSQFICDQIVSLDKCAEHEDTLLITAPCIRNLMKLSGVTLGKKKSAVRPINRARKIRVKEPTWSMATTTKLVNDVFESIFPDQLAKFDTNKVCIDIYYKNYLLFILLNIFFFVSCYQTTGGDDVVFAKFVSNPNVVLVLLVKIC